MVQAFQNRHHTLHRTHLYRTSAQFKSDASRVFSQLREVLNFFVRTNWIRNDEENEYPKLSENTYTYVYFEKQENRKYKMQERGKMKKKREENKLQDMYVSM